MLPEFPVEGGCQCGSVRYRLTRKPHAVYRCHCTDCRKFSGAAYGISMPADRDSVELIKGEPAVYHKQAASGRVVEMFYCPTCLTRLWNHPQGNDSLTVLRAGTLDDTDWAVPVGNIWTQSKVSWIDIDPDEPHFEGQPSSRELLYGAWQNKVGAA